MKQHEVVEKNLPLMAILIAVVISIAGLVEIVPLFFQLQVVEPAPGIKPYTPKQLAGRDIYVREGCFVCHSQLVRPFVDETERYGPYSVAGEFVYDHPFQWGSKRTGPDLARVGGRYSDAWHRAHLIRPQDMVPESNMPGFPWLAEKLLDVDLLETKLKAMRQLGVPYTEKDIDSVSKTMQEVTEMDALIAYLQVLGTQLKPAE